MTCSLHSLVGLLVLQVAVGAESRVYGDQTASPIYREHWDLSYFLSPDGNRMPIRTANDWQARRQHIIAGMEEVMGPLPRPAKSVPLNLELIEERHDTGVVYRKVAYCTDRPDRKISAWLLFPAETVSHPRAAVLCLHQTTPHGKDGPAGLSDRPSMHYALELTKRGYVTLSPDYPSLGDHPHQFETDEYQSGSMKAICDNVRALDLLESLPDVDATRIGCIGHSLGGHNGLFTAVFDDRIKVVVTSCGFTRFHKYMGGDLTGWSGPRYMPLIASRYELSPDRMPFDFTEVIAAIAPRAVFICAPLGDDNFDVDGVRDVVAAAKPIYELLGLPEKLHVSYPDCGHDFPKAERQAAYQFLDKHLAPSH